MGLISKDGSSIIPTIDYLDIHDHKHTEPFPKALRDRGVAVIRGVIPANVAMWWKEQTEDYMRINPDVQCYDMYWSLGQMRARADSRLLEAQHFALSVWQAEDAGGAHMSGGSVERWEANGYPARSGTYKDIIAGKWEEHDPLG